MSPFLVAFLPHGKARRSPDPKQVIPALYLLIEGRLDILSSRTIGRLHGIGTSRCSEGNCPLQEPFGRSRILPASQALGTLHRNPNR